MNQAVLGPGPRSALKRHSERGSHEADVCHALMDEALVCHVAFTVEGEPCVLPMAFSREGDMVWLHGARANRMLGALALGGCVSLAFTAIDGLVLARTAFHHSMNYRSVVAFGRAEEVTDPERKRRALARIVDHALPGRSRELPAMTEAELRATLVVGVRIEEASAKQRVGPAFDEDAVLPEDAPYVGVLPLALHTAGTERDDRLPPAVGPSAAVQSAARRFGAEVCLERVLGGDVYSSDRSRVDADWVYAFLNEQAYWAKGLSRERFEKALKVSVCFGVYRGHRQVAFARALSDGARFAYLADVFVQRELRGQGLGTRLVEFAMLHPALREAARVVLATRDAQAVYQRHGFRVADDVTWMRRVAG